MDKSKLEELLLQALETDELVEYEYQGDEKLGKRKSSAGPAGPK